MPRGRGGGSAGRGSKGAGHKGQRRFFTSPEALEASKEKEERERQWRKQRGDESDEEAAAGEEETKTEKVEESSSSEESSSESEEEGKAKGVQHLIEVENPNRVVKKTKKVEHLTMDDAKETSQLSRKEREEIDKQKARAYYFKLHAAGKTDEARQDLARLALIRKQREDAAKKRDEEKKASLTKT